jgi:hypothetical protein
MQSSLFRWFRSWDAGMLQRALELFPVAAFPLASAVQLFQGVFDAQAVKRCCLLRLSVFTIPRREVGTWIPDLAVSDMCFLCGLRTSVKSFTM